MFLPSSSIILPLILHFTPYLYISHDFIISNLYLSLITNSHLVIFTSLLIIHYSNIYLLLIVNIISHIAFMLLITYSHFHSLIILINLLFYLSSLFPIHFLPLSITFHNLNQYFLIIIIFQYSISIKNSIHPLIFLFFHPSLKFIYFLFIYLL